MIPYLILPYLTLPYEIKESARIYLIEEEGDGRGEKEKIWLGKGGLGAKWTGIEPQTAGAKP
jgi:hypothetical protein